MGHFRIALALVLLAWAAPAARPQEGSARRDASVLAVERAGPAVVNIATERVTEARFGVVGGRYLDEQMQGPTARPGKQVIQNLGSGVLIDPAGYLLTNAHVVARASRIMVTLPGGRELEGELLSLLAAEDLALVKVPADQGPLPVVRLGAPGDVLIGETCLALGNPFGLGNTVTRGVVSARGRRLVHEGHELPVEFLQTDAAINPGNSGGALINLDGELIGINTAALADGKGIGFAIPVGHLRRALARLSDPLLIRERWLGVELEDAPGGQGALVVSVHPGGPGDKAGLRRGDRVVAAGADEVHTAFQLHRAFLGLEEPAAVRLSVASAEGAPRGAVLSPLSPPYRAPIEARLGFVGRDVTPAIAWRHELPQALGIHVDRVAPDSPAAGVGLKPGDVLIKVARRSEGGFEVRGAGTQRELGEFLAACEPGTELMITIRRAGRDYWGELRLR